MSKTIDSFEDAWRGVRSDYTAARTSYFRSKIPGIASVGAGADWHYRRESDFLRLIEFGRHFDRNDCVFGQGVSRFADNIVGEDGYRLDPGTSDDEADRIIADLWGEWSTDADRCDKACEHDLAEQARLMVRAVVIDGDQLHLGSEDGSIETAEAHRCRKPSNTKKNVVNGFLLDDNRKKLECWLTREPISPLRSLSHVRSVRQIPMRDENGNLQVFHAFNPKRVTQTRGISAAAPVFDQISMHDDLEFSQLVKAKAASYFAIIEQDLTGAPRPQIPGKSVRTGEQTKETLSDGTKRTYESTAPGGFVRAPAGKEIKGFSPNVPNAEFFKHANLILTFIAINLDLPVQVFLLDPTATNFSGWRGAMDQAKKSWRSHQKRWVIKRFYRPIYLWKLRNWLDPDSAFFNKHLAAIHKKIGPRVFKHKWHPPQWPYIEPMKDATSNLVRVANSQASQRRTSAEQGIDFNQEVIDSVADFEFQITKAMEAVDRIKSAYPEQAADLNWRELARLPTLQGIKINLDASGNEKPDSTDSDADQTTDE